MKWWVAAAAVVVVIAAVWFAVALVQEVRRINNPEPIVDPEVQRGIEALERVANGG